LLFRRRHPLLQPLPSGSGSLGSAPQAVGQGFTLLLDEAASRRKSSRRRQL
jgi:hypothetical protein